MLLRLYVLLVLPCALLHSQSQSLSGTVVGDPDSTPIAAATVSLTCNQSTKSVLTDNTGSFFFSQVPPGSCSLNAQRPGYAQTANSTQAIQVTADKPPSPLRIRLPPLAKLSGKVTDENGYPFPGASVTLVRRIVSDGRGVPYAVQQSVTNDLGEFNISSIAAGAYLACVTAQPSSYQAHHHLTYLKTCYPGTTDLTAAIPLTLQVGEQQQLSFHLSPVPGFRVNGSINSKEQWVNISLLRADPLDFPTSQTPPTNWDAATGAFEIRAVASGDYRLKVTANDPSGGQRHAAQNVHIGSEDVAGVRLVLQDVVESSGTVRFAESDPPTTAQPAATAYWKPNGTLVINAVSSGTFQIPNTLIAPGDFPIQIVTPSGYMTQSIRQGGVEIPDRKISIPDYGEAAPLEILLRKGGGSIEAHLTDTNPTPEPVAFTLLHASANGSEWFQEGPTINTNSPVTFNSIPPGDYLLFAWPLPNQIEYLNPQVLAQYRAYGQTITVRESETTRVSVQAVPVR